MKWLLCVALVVMVLEAQCGSLKFKRYDHDDDSGSHEHGYHHHGYGHHDHGYGYHDHGYGHHGHDHDYYGHHGFKRDHNQGGEEDESGESQFGGQGESGSVQFGDSQGEQDEQGQFGQGLSGQGQGQIGQGSIGQGQGQLGQGQGQLGLGKGQLGQGQGQLGQGKGQLGQGPGQFGQGQGQFGQGQGQFGQGQGQLGQGQGQFEQGQGLLGQGQGKLGEDVFGQDQLGQGQFEQDQLGQGQLGQGQGQLGQGQGQLGQGQFGQGQKQLGSQDQGLLGQQGPNLFPGVAAQTLGNNQVNTTEKDCIRNCPVTSEFNPVCGTDNVTYGNPGRLICAKSCGVDVSMWRTTSCTAPLTPPVVVSPPDLLRQPNFNTQTGLDASGLNGGSLNLSPSSIPPPAIVTEDSQLPLDEVAIPIGSSPSYEVTTGNPEALIDPVIANIFTNVPAETKETS